MQQHNHSHFKFNGYQEYLRLSAFSKFLTPVFRIHELRRQYPMTIPQTEVYNYLSFFTYHSFIMEVEAKAAQNVKKIYLNLPPLKNLF